MSMVPEQVPASSPTLSYMMLYKFNQCDPNSTAFHSTCTLEELFDCNLYPGRSCHKVGHQAFIIKPVEFTGSDQIGEFEAGAARAETDGDTEGV
jgi:hypothetical protein